MLITLFNKGFALCKMLAKCFANIMLFNLHSISERYDLFTDEEIEMQKS